MSRNKDYIWFRKHHSRKLSHINTDLFNFLLITSDPKITGLRNHIKVSSTKLPPEAIGLMNIDNSKANEFNVEKTEKKN